MENKIKSFLITIGFFSILIIALILNIFAKDKEISDSERRKARVKSG